MNTGPSLKKKNQNSEYSLEKNIQKFYMGMLLDPLKKIPALPEIASGMNVSITKFQKTFKGIYGCSHYQAYLNIRLELAKQMLLTKEYRVWEISKILGYCQTAKFITQFKEKTGMTPKKYTKTYKP